MATGIPKGSRRFFSPNAAGDPAIVVCTGRVEVVRRISEKDKAKGLAHMYRVRNLENGMECVAFGDELIKTYRGVPDGNE